MRGGNKLDLTTCSPQEFANFQKAACNALTATAVADDRTLVLVAQKDGSWILYDTKTDEPRYGVV